MTPASQAYKSDLEREGKARAKTPFALSAEHISASNPGSRDGLPRRSDSGRITFLLCLSLSLCVSLCFFLLALLCFALLGTWKAGRGPPALRSSERPHPSSWLDPQAIPSANSSWHHASISFSQPGHRARSVPRKGNGALEPTWLLSLFYFSLSLFCDGKAKTVNAKLTLFAEKVLRALETRHVFRHLSESWDSCCSAVWSFGWRS